VSVNYLGKSAMAAVTLLTAGASAAAVLAATPASAEADSFAAVAVGDLNDAPPVKTVGGFALGLDAGTVNQAAISTCVRNGGHQCTVVMSAKNACVAAASNDFGQIEGFADPAIQGAEQEALRKVKGQGAHIVVSGCANGEQAPPKPGPSVTFNPVVGGLEAHVTDRSGVASSKCAYLTDGYNTSFPLAANGTFDVRIVPAVPRFKNWTVTIVCDNGTRSQTTTFF
jgi:hypothetical protein